MQDLAGKAVLITGASRGIGAAAARVFAEAGSSVLLAARTGKEIEELAGEIRAGGGKAEAVTCDVSSYAQVEAAVNRCRDAFASIDFLVNNAGVIDPIGPLIESDPQEWGKATDINYKGVYNGLRAALPHMKAQGSGVVVNISSGAAHNALEGWSHYCSAKAAAYMLTRAADLEMKGTGVRVVGLSPGTVATYMQKAIKASGINPVSQLDPSVHIDPSWVGRAIAWLCTGDAQEFAGVDVSLREEDIRRRVGLID
ncbi:SDR family NAD(P)-dependent oxidoreductase [Stappia sp. GBMRC 2046]|uniref:SDR family NAD(P)-dependent oxidoreductase n=1 Tax=Stappia sediminis TaxID=2692190 RepID=A0A7X3LRN2_9HYPH|nr:SDR family oxidoreductase [Stappia sediminis]MXN63847.1 SDR family NAD(P)-dependent oxidoreductase [Stappia sediminis]